MAAVRSTLRAGAQMSERRAPFARVRVLDLLRLLAALQMVQGHTVDAVLALDTRQGAVYAAWAWLRGLTSVAFLFVTGLAFHLVALRNLDSHVRDPGAVGRRFRRAGYLLALGYALHAPVALLWGQDPRAAWNEAVIVDVLQCIGGSLLLLELLALGLRSAPALRVVCALLAPACLLLSPLAGRLDASGPLRPVLNYLTPSGGSVFPLLPWMAHVLLGVLLAPWLLAPGRRAQRWLVCGLAGVMLAGVATAAGAPVAGMQLSRLGWVLVGGAGLELLEPYTRAWPEWVWRLSSETLFIYALHVVLVYGQGVGLSQLIGPTLPPGLALLAAVWMIALSFGAALGYRRALPTLAARNATG
jgi:uncharacterized membrane protein